MLHLELELNVSFKRNRHRFPDDFAFQLTAKEFSDLRSYIETSSGKGIIDSTNTENSSQFAISSSQESNVSEPVTICDQFQPSSWKDVSPVGLYRTWRRDGCQHSP